MKWVWTWSGKSFGWIENDHLITHDGVHAGIIHGAEIYAADGRYLGEIKNENRLITSLAKKGRRWSSFTPRARSMSRVPYVNYAGYVMYAGYEDFPAPVEFLR